MPSIKVSSYEHSCTRCLKSWRSDLERPRNCPKCKSPYWDKQRSGNKYDCVRDIEPGSSVIVPWNNGIAYQGHPVSKIIRKLNIAGAGLTVEWKADGAHISRPNK